MTPDNMQIVPIEKLPNGDCLYKTIFEQHIQPGQWLTSLDDKFPVFHYANREVQFIGPESLQITEAFQLAGTPLQLPDIDRKTLFLADNAGIPMLLFLINQLRDQWGIKKLRSRIYQILLGSAASFPFTPVPSRFMLSGIPPATIASAQLLEDLSLPGRLASEAEAPGCFPGCLAELLEATDFQEFSEVDRQLVAIGSENLLATTKKLFAGDTDKQFFIRFETS